MRMTKRWNEKYKIYEKKKVWKEKRERMRRRIGVSLPETKPFRARLLPSQAPMIFILTCGHVDFHFDGDFRCNFSVVSIPCSQHDEQRRYFSLCVRLRFLVIFSRRFHLTFAYIFLLHPTKCRTKGENWGSSQFDAVFFRIQMKRTFRKPVFLRLLSISIGWLQFKMHLKQFNCIEWFFVFPHRKCGNKWTLKGYVTIGWNDINFQMRKMKRFSIFLFV